MVLMMVWENTLLYIVGVSCSIWCNPFLGDELEF